MKLHPAQLLFLLLPGCGLFNPLTPSEAVRLMDSPQSADARREGIATLVTTWDFARGPLYQTRYRRLATTDPDPVVRAMAVRALNICRDASSTKIFIDGLNDDNDAVRLESAKALANVPDPAGVPGLLSMSRGTRAGKDVEGMPTIIPETKDARIAAVDALRHYPTLDVEHALVDVLNEPDFGVSWQARQSLVLLTGQDFRYSAGAWLQYLTRG